MLFCCSLVRHWGSARFIKTCDVISRNSSGVDESTKKYLDTRSSRNEEDVEFGIARDDFSAYETLVFKRPN